MNRQEQTLGEKIARLDGSRGFVNNFDSFIDFALFPLLANPTKEQIENFEAHRREQAYLDALLMLGELSEGYHDCLGDMFMERISHGANSQFFTPDHICEFMAEITDNVGESICDPTCGSGRFLLAGMKSSRERHNAEPTLYGCDLDERCTRMTLLNVCLNSGRGDIEWGNTLTLDIYRTYHIDRIMVGGKWMSYVWQYSKDDDLNALNEERQKTAQKLLECGVLYERPTQRSKEPRAVPEDVQPEPVEEVPQEKPLPPIVEPERKQPVQLSFDF